MNSGSTNEHCQSAVLQKLSHLVIRTLRRLGYLEAGIDAAVAAAHDPLLDNEPERARTMAASVTQRIAFGERAGEKVRRIGSGFGSAGERPELTGPRCASINGFSLHANTQIPGHRRDQLERLMRYTARGAVALERLAEDANGDLVYTFSLSAVVRPVLAKKRSLGLPKPTTSCVGSWATCA